MATALTLFDQQPPSVERSPKLPKPPVDALLGVEAVQGLRSQGSRSRRGLPRIKVEGVGIRSFLDEIEKRETARAAAVRRQKALRWIADNRREYAGQWVALSGGKLLAARHSVKELYLAIKDVEVVPLVVRIETEEGPPLTGW